METRQFELSEGKSNKFWRITLDGSSCAVNFGRRGTAGQAQTKEFSTADAARKAYEKLIEEKLKKGYVESPANGHVQTVPAKPTPVAVIEAEEPIEKPVPRLLSRGQEPDALPIILEPAEWAYATWRPRVPKPRPPAPKFTVEDGLKRLDRVIGNQGYRFSWDDARLPAAMTREEARFWVEAIARSHRIRFQDFPSNTFQHTAEWQVVMKELVELDFSTPFSIEQAGELLRHSNLPTAILLPLYHLFPWDDVIRLLEGLPKQRGGWLPVWDDTFRQSMYWHLPDHELELLREAVRGWLPLAELSGHLRPSWVLPLAGQIGGLHKELKAVLDAMPAANYPVIRTSFLFDLIFGLGNPADVIEHARRQKLILHRREYMAAWLAHTEFSALDFIVESIAALNKSDSSAPMRAFRSMVNAPDAAPAMLALLNTKSPALAKEWLDAHPHHTFFGLLPAVGSTNKETAERALEFVRAAAVAIEPGGREAAYERLSEGARRRLEARESFSLAKVVEEIPQGLREAFDFAIKQKMKTPGWITAANVPPVIVKEGRLPEEYISVLLAALKHGEPRIPHPFVLAMRCYATPESVDAFASAVFEQWRTLGMESREKWALFTLGAFGSDRAALQLAPYVRNWPGESKSQTAILGLEVLRNIGTDTAILQINGIAQKTKFAALKKRAQECMEEVAKDRNLSRDELEDRIVPDCGLDERGKRVFDFGPRQFELRIGEGLKPVVVGPDGARKPNLPPPNSRDDLEKANAAVADWKVVKKQVADVAKTQVTRLEQALVTQRRWTKEDFERLLVQHPLMTNLVRLLVWGVYASGKLVATFRVAEDRTYTSARDEEFELEPEAVIGLPHPLQMGEADKNSWGELFGDYEILSPFAQLTRPTQKLTADELPGKSIERHTGAQLEPVVFGSVLQSRGWMRGAVGDGGSILEHIKYFPSSDMTAVLSHTPLIVGYLDIGEKIQPEKLCFVRGYSRGDWGHMDDGRKVPLAQIDDVVISEVLTDLDYLASKEKK